MNFRGVGASDGEFDRGEGETQDWLKVLQAMRERYGGLPVAAGWIFVRCFRAVAGRPCSE